MAEKSCPRHFFFQLNAKISQNLSKDLGKNDMGGLGSGRWSREGTRVPVETCYILDVNRLLQQGALRSGVCTTQSWSSVDEWGKTVHDASIGVEATPHRIALRYTTTDYDSNRTEHDYDVLVKWARCHFGGKRPYFVCPGVVNGVTCMRRVAKLYKPPASQYFLCRHCHNLTYYSCNESGDLHFTARRRAKRAARKLGLTDPEDVYSMDRPNGMHKRTFQRLRKDAIDAIEHEHWAFGVVVRKFASSL
jgi:hypothetical protein